MARSNARSSRAAPDPAGRPPLPGRVLPPVAEIMAIETRRSKLPPSRANDAAAWRVGFDYLARTYRPAMVQYVGAIVRGGSRRVGDRELAEEIVQAWFASSMEKDWLVPKSGPIRSFRAFLKDQLRKFTYDEFDRRSAKCRAPERIRSLGGGEEPASDRDDPAAAVLDRSLVDVAVAAAMRRLRSTSPAHAAALEILLANDGAHPGDLAAVVGLERERGRDVAASARRRFAKLFREELERTVRDAEELERLLRTLERYLP